MLLVFSASTLLRKRYGEPYISALTGGLLVRNPRYSDPIGIMRAATQEQSEG